MTKMQKVELKVKMNGIYSFEIPSYRGYGYDTKYIYNMSSEDGKVYVWKTTCEMWLPYGSERMLAQEEDVIRIVGFLKGEQEYKGVKQTLLCDVKCKEVFEYGRSWEERKAQKRQKQIESMGLGDRIVEVTYREYKQKFSDCETLENSFERRNGVAYISIIKKG